MPSMLAKIEKIIKPYYIWLYHKTCGMGNEEKTPNGDPIYRYDDFKPKGFEPAIGDGENIEAISDHIEKYAGKIETIYHEIISDKVHVDVHFVKAGSKFQFHTLVTSGMSDKPMNTPEGQEAKRFAELCILLPADWKIDEESFKDEANYWPVRWLKYMARFPHEFDTWLGWGHTLPNGPDADPFADNTKLGCMMLYPSISLPSDFFELKINEEKTIRFYCMMPLYKEEMDYKLEKGSEPLTDLFEKAGITDIVDINRPNVCQKKKGWFNF